MNTYDSTRSTSSVIVRELIFGAILVPVSIILLIYLTGFFLPPSVKLPQNSFILIFGIMAIIASLVVYFVGKNNWHYGSFLYTLLFSSLSIAFYTSIIFYKYADFTPTWGNSLGPIILIGYPISAVIGAVIGFNIKHKKRQVSNWDFFEMDAISCHVLIFTIIIIKSN